MGILDRTTVAMKHRSKDRRHSKCRQAADDHVRPLPLPAQDCAAGNNRAGAAPSLPRDSRRAAADGAATVKRKRAEAEPSSHGLGWDSSAGAGAYSDARRSGTLIQTFGRMGGGVVLGETMAGSFLSTIAGGPVIGSMIAQQFFSHEIGFDVAASIVGTRLT